MKAKRKTARSAKPASAPKTASDIVRELHKRHPDWSYAELAAGCVPLRLLELRGQHHAVDREL